MNVRYIRHVIVLILLCLSTASAQNFTGGFPFSLPYNDSTTQKFLPAFPASAIDNQYFVNAGSDGHFYRNGSRIRFWGSNLVADGAFPQKSTAPIIAGRMRKFGFNLMRMHHLDNPWGQFQIFNSGQSTRTLNAISLDRLDYLIAALKLNGIFVNMNLNVSRKFNQLDGVLYADSLFDMAKGVTLFDPHLIMLQKEYAQQLLAHVNPYTGKKLVDDPVMAMVEIVNENSLFRMWYDNRLKPYAMGGALTVYHTKMLDSAWHAFLNRKYGSTAVLQQSWNQGAMANGAANMMYVGDFEAANYNSYWAVEQNNGATATFVRDFVNPYEGAASAKIIPTAPTGTYWHLQFKQSILSVKKDTVYAITFSARSDSTRKINLAVMRNNSPYTYYSGMEIVLSPTWKTYTFTFKAPEDNNGQTRVAFQFASRGTYWFDAVSMKTSGLKGLQEGETLENSTVQRIDFSACNAFTDNRAADMTRFYIALQDSFYMSMKRYLKETLGVKVPVSGTNWNIGPTDMAVQGALDYIDNHSYWDHPVFPGVPWSSTDWYINNQPMVKSADGGTMPSLFAGVKVQGKPMTISEYNHPFPNIYQTEGLLFLLGYASLHDIDGIMLFDYNGITTWETDYISSYFDIHRNTAYMSLMPAIASAFRNGYITPSPTATIIDFAKRDIDLLPKKVAWDWAGPQLYNKKLALQQPVMVRSFDAPVSTDFSTLPSTVSTPYTSSTREVFWNTGGIFKIGAKQLAGLTGQLSSFPNTNASSMTLLSGSDYATCVWISLTGDSLPVSKTTLLNISTRSQNAGMIWNGTTTVNNHWGNAPTETKPLTASFALNVYADSLYVYPLDVTGNYSSIKKYVIYPSAQNSFTVSLNTSIDKTVWYGIEKYGSGGLGIESGETPRINSLRLHQNYPNPFNGSTNIVWEQPSAAETELSIYSVTGALMNRIQFAPRSAGVYTYQWNAKDSQVNDVAAGIYFVTVKAGSHRATRKLVYLK